MQKPSIKIYCLKLKQPFNGILLYIVDHSPQHVLQSIEKWLKQYKERESPFYPIAKMTSQHVCNLLKALFATEQFELFEQLINIYIKYLILQEDFEDLRNFVSNFVQK